MTILLGRQDWIEIVLNPHVEFNALAELLPCDLFYTYGQELLQALETIVNSHSVNVDTPTMAGAHLGTARNLNQTKPTAARLTEHPHANVRNSGTRLAGSRTGNRQKVPMKRTSARISKTKPKN